jgi:hypothetical protein
VMALRILQACLGLGSLLSPAHAQTSPSVPVNHIVVIVLENQDLKDTLKNPYFLALANQGAWLSNSLAVSHPSYPNYLALVGGDTFKQDGTDEQTTLHERFIVDALEEAGKTWRAYSEGYPGGCFLGADRVSTFWTRKHVPFLSFASVQSGKRCENVVEGSRFKIDLDARRLPSYAFYTPNMKNDGHDTNLKVASAWLQGFLGSFHARLTADLSDTLVIVTFDESKNLTVGRNNIFTVLLGSMVKPGEYRAKVTHYTMLRTVEHLLGIPPLGRRDSRKTPIAGIWL